MQSVSLIILSLLVRSKYPRIFFSFSSIIRKETKHIFDYTTNTTGFNENFINENVDEKS